MAATEPAEFSLSRLDLARADGRTLDVYAAFAAETSEAQWPSRVGPSADEIRRRVAAGGEPCGSRWIAQTGDGGVVGCGTLTRRRASDVGLLTLDVLERARCRGLGHALLRACIADSAALAISEGETTTRSSDRWWSALALGAGGRPVRTVLAHEVSVHRLLNEVLQQWIDLGRRSGCVLSVGTGCHDETSVSSVAVLRDLVHQEYGAVAVTPAVAIARLRRAESLLATCAMERWTVCARTPAGTVVGVSEAVWDPAEPTVLAAELSAVDVAFRGRGLARWMMAVKWQTVVDARPAIRFLRAHSLPGGLDRAFTQAGFGTHDVCTTWQIGIAGLATYLDDRGDDRGRRAAGSVEGDRRLAQPRI